ncbi:MAG: endonuclease/exonuclease/phosphatase family protein [Alphaproteobacteria bacterium]|nr:endonuclease/exonuclease/phosphatase family protein [Alphaproteobacteria bacterium]
MRRLISRAWTAIIVFACISVCSAFVAQTNPILDLLAVFALQAALFLLFASLIDGMRGQWLRVAMWVVLSAAGVTLVWPRAQAQTCEEGMTRKRIVFLNLWIRNPDPVKSIEAILRMNADVVALAELSASSKKAEALLLEHYPYATDCNGAPECGLRIFSREPVADLTAKMLGDYVSESAGAVDLNWGKEGITLIASHLTQPWPLRPWGSQGRQMKAMADGMDRLDRVDLWVGDFNAVTWGAIPYRIKENTGLAPVQSWGTWPGFLMAYGRIPIDHVFAKRKLGCIAKEVGPDIGSDHRPIIIDLGVK